MNISIEKEMLVLWSGSFGEAVAKSLASKGGTRCSPFTDEVIAEPRAHLDMAVDLMVFVGNRPMSPGLLRIDEFLWKSDVAWTVCELNDTRLLLGPNVIPGASPCFRCCSSRYRSMTLHKAELDQEAAFERYMAINPDLQVNGFTPSIVGMAVSHILATRRDCAGRAGLIREISMPDMNILQGRAVALHGCRLCRPNPSNPADRFTVGLKAAIGRL